MEHRTDLAGWPCAVCGQETGFEQPPCVDGHTDEGGECPEWVCIDCGTALVVGDLRADRPAGLTRAA